MSTKKVNKVEKILIKVIGHGKDATKCQWGIFKGDMPLAESELKNGVKSARNVLAVATAAKKYATDNGLKNSQMIDDIISNENLKALSETAKFLSGERAKAKKDADEKLKALLDESDDGKRPALRNEWQSALDKVEAAAEEAKEAQAELIAACDAWFQKRIEAQKAAK
jgi:hypothetical protein